MDFGVPQAFRSEEEEAGPRVLCQGCCGYLRFIYLIFITDFLINKKKSQYRLLVPQAKINQLFI